jgi:hypothetical protein
VLEQAASAVTPTNGASSGTTSVLAAAAEVSSSTPSTPEPENNNGNKDDKDSPKHRSWVPDASTIAPLRYQPLSDSERGWANFKLLFALPWRRFKKDAVLSFKLEGEISDQLQVGGLAIASTCAGGVFMHIISRKNLLRCMGQKQTGGLFMVMESAYTKPARPCGCLGTFSWQRLASLWQHCGLVCCGWCCCSIPTSSVASVVVCLQGRFSPGFSMPQIIDALEKAAVDPRVKGIAVEISPLVVRRCCQSIGCPSLCLE